MIKDIHIEIRNPDDSTKFAIVRVPFDGSAPARGEAVDRALRDVRRILSDDVLNHYSYTHKKRSVWAAISSYWKI